LNRPESLPLLWSTIEGDSEGRHAHPRTRAAWKLAALVAALAAALGAWSCGGGETSPPAEARWDSALWDQATRN